MDARSAREWPSEVAARAICPNSLRRRCCISEETGGWLVCAANALVFYALIANYAGEAKKRAVNLLIINQSLIDLTSCLLLIINYCIIALTLLVW